MEVLVAALVLHVQQPVAADGPEVARDGADGVGRHLPLHVRAEATDEDVQLAFVRFPV